MAKKKKTPRGRSGSWYTPTSSTSGGGGAATEPILTPAAPSTLPLKVHNYLCNKDADGLTNADRIAYAVKYSNIVTDADLARGGLVAADLKLLKPSLKVYRYYALCGRNPDENLTYSHRVQPLRSDAMLAGDYDLKDGDGNAVHDEVLTTWNMIDVGISGYKEEYLAALLADAADNYPGIDGIVLDWWFPAMISEHPGSEAQYATDALWFSEAWQPFITYVVAGIKAAGYRVIGNAAGEYAPNVLTSLQTMYNWQRLQLDGTVYEQGAWGWSGEALSGGLIERRIEALRSDPLEIWWQCVSLRHTERSGGQVVPLPG
jgi:hypothetical protein